MVGLARTELDTTELEVELEDVTILLLLVDDPYCGGTCEEEEEDIKLDDTV
jgi:hypothetical protein